MKKQSFSEMPAERPSIVVTTMLNQAADLPAHSAPVPLLDLAYARVHSGLVKVENGSDISSAFNLATLGEELR